MTKRDRQIRRNCPYVELVGQHGYQCNKGSFWGGQEPREFAFTKSTPRNQSPCFGCKEMYNFVKTTTP